MKSKSARMPNSLIERRSCLLSISWLDYFLGVLFLAGKGFMDLFVPHPMPTFTTTPLRLSPVSTVGGGLGRFLPNPKLKLREQLAEVCRYRHMSHRTESAYWHWIKGFILFHRGKGLSNARPHPGSLPQGEGGGAHGVSGSFYLAAQARDIEQTKTKSKNHLHSFLYKTWSGVRLLPFGRVSSPFGSVSLTCGMILIPKGTVSLPFVSVLVPICSSSFLTKPF